MSRGHDVAVIKHMSHDIDMPGKDTTVLAEVVGEVGFSSPRTSGIFWGKPMGVEDLILHMEADLVLVEGFKREKTYPKIVSLQEGPDYDDPERLGGLFDGLAICAVGPAGWSGPADVAFLDRDDIGSIADLVERKAFRLPGLDCGGCGHEQCYHLAQEIVAGFRGAEACVSLAPEVEVKIEGQALPLTPFVSSVVRGTITGLLSPLKGFRSGHITISLGS
jgi:molybdopterin-guanine dinucleotide biosynthesis protein B